MDRKHTKETMHDMEMELLRPENPGHGSYTYRKLKYKVHGWGQVVELHGAKFTMQDIEGDTETGPHPELQAGDWEVLEEGQQDLPIEEIVSIWEAYQRDKVADEEYERWPLW